MGLNEYRVLEQVWNGRTHAQEIAEATRFHPQLVKACLISLERAHVLEYKQGYKPYVPKKKAAKPITRRHYTKRATPITDMVIEYMKSRPEGVLCREMSEAIEVNHASVRNVLNLQVKAGRIGTRKEGKTCVKWYFLMGE
jgi:DNA-binding transcriptional regulator YhcF (GntR family)